VAPAVNDRLAENSMDFPLSTFDPASLGLDPKALERLGEIITRHLAEGRYPGAQIAVARRGPLGLVRTFGDAGLGPERVAARDDTLWLLYSGGAPPRRRVVERDRVTTSGKHGWRRPVRPSWPPAILPRCEAAKGADDPDRESQRATA
jgi:hypothetical protein